MSDNSVTSLPSEWEQQDSSSEMIDDQRSFASSSCDEASKVFEQWQTDDMMMMDVDENIGSGMLGGVKDEVLFAVDHCPPSPTTPMEELHYLNFGHDEMDSFCLSLMSNPDQDEWTSSNISSTSSTASDQQDPSSMSFQQRYEATLHKLAKSMKRSQETRKSLVMRTKQMEHYARNPYVSEVMESIETSSLQLQNYLPKQAI